MQLNSNDKERILIVDDTPANIDVLGAMLMDDYEISVAVNGSMALDIASSNTPPDIILLDIMMPVMDGYEVAKKLKSSDKTRRIPIIFVTAKIEDTDEALGFDLGAVDYIRKPVNASVTMARIKSQLELKRYRDRLTLLVEEKSTQVVASQKDLNDKNSQLSKVTQDLRHKEIAAHKNQVYFKELFMSSPYGIILVGIDNRIIRSNNSFSKLLGYSVGEVLNKKLSKFLIETGEDETHKDLINRAIEGDTVSIETRCSHKNGYLIPISAMAYPVKIKNQVQGVFVFYENISHRKVFEEKLKHQAYHDSLTGIPNRLFFSERLDYVIENQKNSPQIKFAVLLIDLDRFKSVNDTLGHQAGDELLKKVTSKIQVYLRSKDTLARLGGDEFAVLLPDIKDKDQVSMIASRIRDAAESRFIIENQHVHISASIGIVFDTARYADGNHLLRDADLAMYNAKDSGKAQFKFFSPQMHENLMNSVTLEKELRAGIENDQFELYFQPIIRVSDLKTEGFEALVRWNFPGKGVIPPDQFIPIAEETGLIIPMGDWIIRSACKRMNALKQRYKEPLSLNINVSVKQFLQKDFHKDLLGIINEYGLKCSDIKLEFTESLLMEHTDSAVRKLEELKKSGFSLAIDDFGTGYSSLSYLQKFPIDQIKIDRSFINSMGRHEESYEIVKSILSLSKSLGLTIVAEGVETEEQLKMLSQLSCESAQGYYFSKPMPFDKTEKFLMNHGKSFMP